MVHLVDAMGGSKHLWGKERVVALLMREQRASGLVEPALVSFSPGSLNELVAAEGFSTGCLSSRPSHGFERSVGRLSRLLKAYPADVIHSHGYRANIVARAVRLSGRARGIRLVSTCHGWGGASLKVGLYHTLDRWTSVVSDVTTVPDAAMLAAFPPFARRCHIQNGVPDVEPGAEPEPFVRPGTFVVGTLGRVSAAKGIAEFLAAAAAFPDPAVVFTVAGDGDLTPSVRAHGGNVHYAGYFAQPEGYLEGLDVYVQASHSEGLSLALLEAMRAGKPIVATGVGATRHALTDGESALIVAAGRPDELGAAILRLRRDPELAARLGASARARFEADFRIGRQHLSYLNLYETPDAKQRLAS